ncbi:MAG: diguanylate cyclase [Pseudomonadota bacterium]
MICTLFILDTNMIRAGLIAGGLGQNAFHIERFQTVRAANAAFHKIKPDAVLCATDLEDGCGFEFVAELTSRSEMAFVPLFLYSDRPMVEDHAKAFSSGALALLQHPADFTSLRTRLPPLMRGRSLLKELDLHIPKNDIYGLAEARATFTSKPEKIKFSATGVSPSLITRCLDLGLEFSHASPKCELIGTESGIAQAFSNLVQSADHPKVLVTNDFSEAILNEALALGANDVLPAEASLSEIGGALRYQAQIAGCRKNRISNMSALIDAAQKDSVTGLFNRNYASDYLDRALLSLNAQGTLGLLLIDLDGFKRVNDTFGHALGDRLLADVGYQLKAALREETFLARWGGDEFVAIVPDISMGQLLEIGYRLIEAIETLKTPSGQALSASFGATLTRNGETISRIPFFNRADRALYRAKNCGRGTGEVA